MLIKTESSYSEGYKSVFRLMKSLNNDVRLIDEISFEKNEAGELKLAIVLWRNKNGERCVTSVQKETPFKITHKVIYNHSSIFELASLY